MPRIVRRRHAHSCCRQLEADAAAHRVAAEAEPGRPKHLNASVGSHRKRTRSAHRSSCRKSARASTSRACCSIVYGPGVSGLTPRLSMKMHRYLLPFAERWTCARRHAAPPSSWPTFRPAGAVCAQGRVGAGLCERTVAGEAVQEDQGLRFRGWPPVIEPQPRTVQRDKHPVQTAVNSGDEPGVTPVNRSPCVTVR